MNPKTFQQTRRLRDATPKVEGKQAQRKKSGDRALSTQVPQLQINYSHQSSININDSQQQINNRILNYEEQEDFAQNHKSNTEKESSTQNRDTNFKRQHHQALPKGRSQEMFLSLKVDQLQNMCNALSQANKKLLNKINLLEQNQPSLPFIDDFSEMQSEFSQVQNLIQQYRGHLDAYQQKLQAEIVDKNSLVLSLKQQITSLVETNATISEHTIQLQKANQVLISKNQDLQQQIQNMRDFYQVELQKQRKSVSNYSRVHISSNSYQNGGSKYIPQSFSSREYREHRLISQPRTQSKHQFQINKQQNRYEYDNDSQYSRITPIQRLNTHNLSAQESAREQMEILIQRLVNQLQHQKRVKNKMNQQIKRLNRQLVAYQKQILDKNNKIYFLQLNAIRAGKTLRTSKSTTQLDQREAAYNRSGIIQQDDRMLIRNHSQNHLARSFPFINLLNKEIQISDAAKIQIARKIVALYQRKLQQRDYNQIMIQEIQIMNFSENNLDILYVRQICKTSQKQILKRYMSNNAKQQQKQTHSLLFNMVFCLDNLFNQVPDSKQHLIQAIKAEFLQMLQSILSSHGTKITIIKNLSELSLFLDKALVNIIKSIRR